MRTYVFQDGATFYLSRDPDGEEAIGTMSAPFKVKDGDMPGAMSARKWFVEQATRNAIDYFWI